MASIKHPPWKGRGHAYVVAEIGSNHNHDLALAHELIAAAAEAGADAVKFQLFRAEHLYPPHAGTVETPMGHVDLHELFSAFALPSEWLTELRDAAVQIGVDFLCAPFDEETLGQLADLALPAIKIASPELNHLPLLRRAADLHWPMICSTGLSTLADVQEAVDVIRSAWPEPELVLLQCVSAYPLAAEQANLGVIDTLSRAFGFPAGLSDHTTEAERTPAVAVAYGAVLIEKHFTLDRTLAGPDHSFALEPADFAKMIAAIRTVEAIAPGERLAWVRQAYDGVQEILGTGQKTIQAAEQDLYPNDKRSIHAIVDVPAGEALSDRNVRILRSERNLRPGLHPRYWEVVLGALTVSELRAGEGVSWEHLIRHRAKR